MQALLLLVGRVCLAALFLFAGWTKIKAYAASGAAMRMQGIPFVQVALPLAILIEIGGALAIVAGFRARFAAYFLIIYCVAISYFSPAFWRLGGGEFQLALAGFLNQLAIIGGLLFLAATGPGRISLDRS